MSSLGVVLQHHFFFNSSSCSLPNTLSEANHEPGSHLLKPKVYHHSKDIPEKMDSESRSGSKRGPIIDWVKRPFERLNHSTNFEEYACSPPDCDFLGSLEAPVSGLGLESAKSNQGTSRISGQTMASSLAKKTRDSSLGEGLLRENGVVSVPSSKEGTPYGTPSSSPTIPRKKIGGSLEIYETIEENTTGSSISSNKKWFLPSGFFGAITINRDTGSASIYQEKLDKKSNLRKFHVTNFDINAVGPTSW